MEIEGKPVRNHHGSVLGSVVVLLLVIVTASACAKSGTVAQAGGSSPAAPQNCGAVSIPMATGKPTVGPGAKAGAETCFDQAFVACKPATLQATWWGVDAGTKAELSISGSPCTVTVAPSTYRMPSFNSPEPSYTCTQVALASKGLTVSGCSGGKDLMLPTEQPSPGSSGTSGA